MSYPWTAHAYLTTGTSNLSKNSVIQSLVCMCIKEGLRSASRFVWIVLEHCCCNQHTSCRVKTVAIRCYYCARCLCRMQLGLTSIQWPSCTSHYGSLFQIKRRKNEKFKLQLRPLVWQCIHSWTFRWPRLSVLSTNKKNNIAMKAIWVNKQFN